MSIEIEADASEHRSKPWPDSHEKHIVWCVDSETGPCIRSFGVKGAGVPCSLASDHAKKTDLGF